MYGKTYSVISEGLGGQVITVEANINKRSMFAFNIIGLPTRVVSESKERIRSSLANLGIKLPLGRITINLYPASLKKGSSIIDLSIAISLLSSLSYIEVDDDFVFLGELSILGDLIKINHINQAIRVAVDAGYTNIVVPLANKDNLIEREGVSIYTFSNLQEVCCFFKNNKDRRNFLFKSEYKKIIKENKHDIDFNQVKGQNQLVRALAISVAGQHHIVVSGPSGSGKTLAAKRLPTILPSLSKKELLENLSIRSSLNIDEELDFSPPFINPSHLSGKIDFYGNALKMQPGAISLAHNGILFLDEFPLYRKDLIELLRLAMEDKSIKLTFSDKFSEFPSNFLLVATMNPCPCGNLASKDMSCTCTVSEISRYKNLISNPLKNRFHINISIERVLYNKINESISSKELKNKIKIARKRQKSRYKNLEVKYNSELNTEQINKYVNLTKKQSDKLTKICNNYKMSKRSYDIIKKLALTIADYENSKVIKDEHLFEAIYYQNNNL